MSQREFDHLLTSLDALSPEQLARSAASWTVSSPRRRLNNPPEAILARLVLCEKTPTFLTRSLRVR